MKELLAGCTKDGIDKNTALEIYSKSTDPLNALELFKKAFQIREETVGNDLQITVPTGVILECKLDMPCRYCNSWASRARTNSSGTKSKRSEMVLQCIPKLRKIGIDKILLVGGSNLNGYDQEILELVKSINDISGTHNKKLWANRLITNAGGVNVAADIPTMEINVEQLLNWNQDVII